VAGQLALSKKQGVSGQSVSPSLPSNTQKHSKDFRTKALVKEAIMDNDFLKNLSSSQVLPLAFLCSSFVLRGPFLSLVPFLSSFKVIFTLIHQTFYVSFLCQDVLPSFLYYSRTVPFLSVARYVISFLSFISFLSSPPLFLHG
jgi:hypothetical protein